MTEIFSPVEPPVVEETKEQVDFAEILRRARTPIIKEGFAEPWDGDQSSLDPVQVGWEQAAQSLLGQIERMQSSGLVQLTPEGLTPKQAAEKVDESAKLAAANARVAESAERLRRETEELTSRSPIEAPAQSPRDQWNQLPDDQRNADLSEWYRKLQAGEQIEDWQRQALKDFNFWGGDSPPPAAAATGPGTQVIRDGEAEISSAAVERRRWDNIRQGLSSYLEEHWKEIAERGVGIAVGAVLGKVAEGSPWIRAGLGMALVATSVRSRLMDSSGRVGRFIELRKNLHPEFYRSNNLAKRVISLTVEAEMRVLQGSFWLTERPALEGIGWGLVLQGVADGLTPDKPVEVGGAGAGAGGGEQVGGGGTNPADQPSPVEDWTGADREVTGVGGQPLAEQVGPQYPGVERLPGGEPAVIPAEDLAPQPGDAELLVQQAAEAAEAVRQQALEAATRVVEVQPGDTLTELVARAGGDPYGADFTNTVLESADVLTGPQNPHRDMAQTLIEFIKAHPDGVNWRDAINGVGDLAKEMVGGMPLKDAIATATRMIYPGQEMKIVVGAGVQ